MSFFSVLFRFPGLFLAFYSSSGLLSRAHCSTEPLCAACLTSARATVLITPVFVFQPLAITKSQDPANETLYQKDSHDERRPEHAIAIACTCLRHVSTTTSITRPQVEGSGAGHRCSACPLRGSRRPRSLACVAGGCRRGRQLSSHQSTPRGDPVPLCPPALPSPQPVWCRCCPSPRFTRASPLQTATSAPSPFPLFSRSRPPPPAPG